MQQLGEDMVHILDTLNVKLVIGLGEGAGANILTRFALAYPDRVLGLVLLHCTSTKAGILEYFNDKVKTLLNRLERRLQPPAASVTGWQLA